MSKYRRLGESAADSFVEEGVPLNDSVEKIAESKGLNPHETNRVVEHANVKTFLSMFKETDDKTFTFDLAEPVSVKKEGTSSMSDYKIAPETKKEAEKRTELQKTAHVQFAAELKRDRDEWVEKLGEAGAPKESINRFEDEWDRAHDRYGSEKRARFSALSQVSRIFIPVDENIREKEAELQPEAEEETPPPDYSLFKERYDDKDWSKEEDVRRVRTQVKAARKAVRNDKSEAEIRGKALEDQLIKEGEKAMKDGYDLPLLKTAVKKAGYDEDIIVKTLDRLTKKRADAKDYRKRNGISEKTKTAAANEDHPLIKTAESLLDWADEYKSIKKQAGYLDQALEKLNEWENKND